MAEGQDLANDATVMKNLKGARFKKTHLPLDLRVTSMTTVGNMAILGTQDHGCHVYSIHEDEIREHCQVGTQTKVITKSQKTNNGSTCHNLCADEENVAYIKEEGGKFQICLHKTKDILRKKSNPLISCDIQQRSPMVLVSEQNFLAVGGLAWKKTWISSGDGASGENESSDTKIHLLDVKTLKTKRQWSAAENCVAILRQQDTVDHCLLAIADSRSGLKVYDLRQKEKESYVCLYQVPVKEIRNFELVGNFVAVFHKFEPNVSFWNMKEQKTILCINIQDQMKQLAEEYMEEDEECDGAFFEEDDDHMTSVTSMGYDGGYMLMYGTKSGCVFGINVETRTKLFNVPSPHEIQEMNKGKRSMLGIGYMHRGKIVGCYEGHGVTVLDFSPEDPPDRPPTRGAQK